MVPVMSQKEAMLDPQNLGALSDRARSVLAGVVDLYTSTGTPVGSKALVENAKLPWPMV